MQYGVRKFKGREIQISSLKRKNNYFYTAKAVYFMTTISIILYNSCGILVRNFFHLGSIITICHHCPSLGDGIFLALDNIRLRIFAFF